MLEAVQLHCLRKKMARSNQVCNARTSRLLIQGVEDEKKERDKRNANLRMCAQRTVKKEMAIPMCQLQLHKQLVTRVTEDSAGPAMLITILLIVSLTSPTNSACHRLRGD